MEFLYFLENIRLPGLNEFMLTITMLGEETAFLVVAMILFWCVDKRRGYYVLTVGLFGSVLSQFMKIICRVPRPWVRDPNFTILEQARDAASGYSFPSGHTQSAVGAFGAVAASDKKNWLKALCIAVAVFVGFSRMYIGVHTPADVLVGAAISVALIVLLYPMTMKHDGKFIPHVLASLSAVSLVYLIFLEVYPFPSDIDADNMHSALKNSYTFLGTSLGLLLAWFVDRKRNFPVKACWWAQLLKIGVGFLLVLAVKEGLRSPLDALCQGHLIARSIRYFLLTVMAGVIWPMSFSRFSKLGEYADKGGNNQ